MGTPTITAGRILKGQLKGAAGEETKVSFEDFPNVGMAKVRNFQCVFHLSTVQCGKLHYRISFENHDFKSLTWFFIGIPEICNRERILRKKFLKNSSKIV